MFLRTLAGIAATVFIAFSPVANAAERSVALVLDASGSMNGRLSDGTPKIDAAKAAVRELTGAMPGETRLSLRAYGHQSHRSEHNCKDTQLLVGFGAAESVRSDVTTNSDGLKAQGYTPITYVLGLAADDLKGEPGKRVIVLVSDGKETCKGDPCVLARKLAEADADLTIHTVGFDVDYQARTQLQCIAKAARGQYFDANSAADLTANMVEASTAAIQDDVVEIVLPKNEPGMLEIVGPYYNEVVDAETGEQVAKITDANPVATLPPGVYNVQFGDNMWLKSVEVVANETTTLTPGRLRIEDPYYNDVLDPETGTKVEKATDGHKEFPMLAGRYDVAFGKALWRGIEIAEGETTVLTPARLRIEGPYYNEVLDAESGEALIKLTDGTPEQPLPPGTYDVQFGDGALWRVELKEGETTVVTPARLKMADTYYNVVIDEATGKAVEKFTEGHTDMPLPAGTYTVMFGKAAWKGLALKKGEAFELKPGRLKIEKEGSFYYMLRDAAGNDVLKLTSGTNDIPFPPGKYTLDVEGQQVPVTISEGKRMVLKIR